VPPGGAAASAPAAKRAPLPEGNLDQPELDDHQLVRLFALEKRRALPACSAAQGTPSAPAAQIAEAQQALLRGDSERAHAALCRATTSEPGNADAQRALAELALHEGDARVARNAVEQALRVSPDDLQLRALLGDALAVGGDLPGARATWLQILPETESEARRSQRLSGSYAKLGRGALAGSSHAQALSLFRRALILTRGSHGPSVGFSEALLGLGYTQAATIWAGRVARAFPKASKLQLLLGDALHAHGDGDGARAAWRAALELRPGYRAAARRVELGTP
jgi:predicted Zn-dependent protease